MNILNPQQALTEPTAVTVGTFDGIHMGHRQILASLLQCAQAEGLSSVMVTFEPPPKRFFSKGKIKNLTTLKEKIGILEELGLENLLILPFNRELVTTGYQSFVSSILIDILKASVLVGGYDFRFGYNRNGDTKNVSQLKVVEIPPLKIDGTPVKSSTIRTLIEEGSIELAEKFLGYNYLISGEVTKGLGIASTLGFPTINILPPPEKLIASNGVYGAVEKRLGPGLVYIGKRPTFDNGDRSIEIHLMDTPEIIPDNISISLLYKLRDERKFPSKKALIDQLILDKEKFRRLL